MITIEEAMKRLKEARFTVQPYQYINEALDTVIKALGQEPKIDRVEYGTDGNAYRLTISNGKEFEKEPCEDCISREHLLEEIASLKESPWFKDDTNCAMAIRKEAIEIVEDLCIRKEPSVNPQKIGHWEQYGNSWEDKFKCSECGKEQPKILCCERIIGHWSDYCPNCGAKMVETSEIEQALAYADQDTLMSAT